MDIFRKIVLLSLLILFCLTCVYCSAEIEVILEDDLVNEGGLNVTKVDSEESRGRGVWARCLQTVWDWIQDKASMGISDIVEDKIISGNPDNVRFYMYPIPENKDYVHEIVYGDAGSLLRSSFRPNAPWKIIIHGFTNHHISEPVQQIKNAYLQRSLNLKQSGSGWSSSVSQNAPTPYFNVVVVDWGQLADPKFGGETGNLFYGFAVKNVPLVGKRVAEFVVFLLNNRALFSLDQVHLIGFSLGSHVSGNAGNILKEMTSMEVGRISGLDPAGPSFYQGLKISSRQLSPEDAKFVDIIHTNQGALGIYKNIGHVDFFPNGGGPVQKPCLVEYGQSQNENAVVMLNTCSHSRAPFFFSLSINRLITACRCDSLLQWKTTCPCKETAVFGEHCDTRTRGTFYLDLNE